MGRTSSRGYGRAHQTLRRSWARRIASGTVRCARGAACRYAVDGLGGLIEPGSAWDLGHDDRDRSRYAGPEHASCNRATSAHRAPRKRPAEEHPGLTTLGGCPPTTSGG